ncbi:unnamed protein product [Tilletia controversa]|nr:unnamed protein product [Tilletia controversa]
MSTSASDDNASQREPTLKDIFDMMQGIQQEQAAQRAVLARLNSTPGVSFQDAALRTPPDPHAHDAGRPYRRVNWDMVKIITKLGWNNWSDWRSRIYNLLGTVPGAIGVLEGTIYGPRYLDPDDLSAHPNYDEALDLELGQVIQSCTEPEVNSLLLKPISDGELRGSFFYRELRVWLVPNQGYAALKLIARMGQHRQREGESIRQFGERLRRFYLEPQSAGETLDQTKQVGFLLTGLRFRFQTVRDSVVSRQAAG